MAKMKPRYYQQDAIDAVIAHVKKRLSPCLIECATGSGKSLIVAELAQFFSSVAPNKRVLCIAPSKELVEQNAEKYALTGNQASIYCASAGGRMASIYHTSKGNITFCVKRLRETNTGEIYGTNS